MGTMQRAFLGDRYTLIEPLGDGGMAEVYLTRDNSLGREVALKVLRERYADDEEFVERFRREAVSAAGLNHPNVVQVYDRGRTEDGSFYIAMEYVPGGTLKERVKAEGSLTPRDAADMASHVADALAVAHDRGIVHRDVKPQNVLLTSKGEAKVSDFGIARAASTETMTQTNAVLGTLAYMSPEQVRGERVGPASDLYSLGVALYEMLTGELPYRGDDPIASAMKRLDEAPPHPREVNPAVSEDLDALVVRLLAKEPQYRYESAASLSEDLRRIRDGLPPRAAGDGAAWRASCDTAKEDLAPARLGAGGPDRRARLGWRRAFAVPVAALLVGAALIGGLTWASGWNAPDRATPEKATARGVEVPALAGLPREEAQGRLEEAGLELGSREEASSGTVAEGAVIEQDPAEGSRVDRGRAVNVVLSTGQSQGQAPRISPPATASATATASPGAAEESAEEAQKRREEARKREKERREEAREGAQQRREERAKQREE